MDKWVLSEKEFSEAKLQKRESLYCQGNGYMGIRNSLEEKYVGESRNALVNGVFNVPKNEVSELSVLPDVTNFEIKIDGERFSLLTGKATEYSRTLNMRTGESERKLVWESPKGKRVKMEFRRFVSDERMHIIAQKIIITPIDACKISAKSGIDGSITNCGTGHFGKTDIRKYKDYVLEYAAETLTSNVTCVVTSNIKLNKDITPIATADRRGVYLNFTIDAKADEELVFEKVSSYKTSRDLEYKDAPADRDKVREDSAKILREAAEIGYDKLFEESKAVLERFWQEKGIIIKSDNDFLQTAVNFSLYHLHIMANRFDDRLGIGAKALSGEGYKGHSFWDTEIFILPYYIYNHPEIARNLLTYRHRLLPVACERAKEFGYEGAMYPWETAWIEDGEGCPKWGDIDLGTGERRVNMMSEIEIHVTCAVSFGMLHYYRVTGDEDFMIKHGYETIIETALFFASRAVEKNGRYEILDVIGPDEYQDPVDNNAYTNYMAHLNMRKAVEYLDILPEHLKSKYDVEKSKAKLKKVIDKLYLPKPDADGIVPQFDGIRDLQYLDITEYKNATEVFTIFNDYSIYDIPKFQVFKQADLVMLLYLMQDLFDTEIAKKNFDYYEERTLHDSSLSMCIHSLVASRLGMRETADKFFEGCCNVDLSEELSNSNGGIHAASIGGIWLAVTMGYGGLYVDDDGLRITPTIPDGWEEYSFPIIYKGEKMRVTVRKGEYEIEKASGEKSVHKI